MIGRIKYVAIWLIVGLCAWAAYRFLFAGPLPTTGAFDWNNDGPRLLYYLIWLAVLLPILFVSRPRLPELMKGILLWGGLGLALVAGYAYRDEIKPLAAPVLSALVPGYAYEAGNGEVVLNRGQDGHFHAYAQIDGTPARMLVDTGASTVTLTWETAEAAGYDPSTFRFNTPVSTANGIAYAAPIRLDTLSIGSISLDNVEAMVAEKGRLGSNLLGMSFLGRLSGYSFAGDRLTLKQ